MRSECVAFRKLKCKRITVLASGLTMSASCLVYVLSILVLSEETVGGTFNRLQNMRNLQNSYENTDILPDSSIASGNSKSTSLKSTHIDDMDDNIFLDEIDDVHVNNKLKPVVASNDGQNKTKRLPQAIIIGVKKAGTRALLEYLRLHPDVRAPGPEPHFFDKNYKKGLNWYRNLMPESKRGQLTVEKTPSYFVTKGIPEKVYRMSKKTKLIVVFRDPVTRAVSDYAQLASRNPGVKSFEEMVYVDNRTKIIETSWTIVKIGIYAQHLARWLEYFPLKQFHFVSGENLIKDPGNEMIKIQQFLGLEPHISSENFTFNQTKGFPCYKRDARTGKWHCLNEEKGRLHPEISTSVRQHLTDFYRPFNIKLYSMTGQNFGWS